LVCFDFLVCNINSVLKSNNKYQVVIKNLQSELVYQIEDSLL